MLQKTDYKIVSLDLFDEQSVVDWFFMFSKMASLRSHITEQLPVSKDFFTNDKHVDYIFKGFILMYHAITVADYDILSDMKVRHELYQRIIKFANKLIEHGVHKEDLSKKLYLSMQVYATFLEDYFGLTNSEAGEIADFFRLCIYLPIMLLQSKRKKIYFGTHNETKDFLSTSIKVASPTIWYFQQRSKEFQIEGALYNTLTEKMFHTSNFGYFIYPLLTCVATLDETDESLIPKMWQHSSLIENRDFPVMDKTCEAYFTMIDTSRKYAMPKDGVEIICKGYGDIHSVFIKERIYRRLHNNFRSLFIKITFHDGLEDLVVVTPELHAIVISPYKDIYENQEDRYTALLLKLYTDFVCVQPNEKISNTKKRKLGLVYRDKKNPSRESIVYLPRSVIDVTKYTNKGKMSDGQKVPHFVNGHLRKLAIGFQASDQAKKIASNFGFILPTGYTFVTPYETGKNAPGKENIMQKRRKIQKGNGQTIFADKGIQKRVYISKLKK